MGYSGPVLRLRLQQGPFRGIRPDFLLDRVPEDALPGGVHGGPAAGREHQQRQDRAVSGRGTSHGHPGAFPRCERIGLRILRRRRRRAIWPRSHPQRRQERRGRDHQGTQRRTWQIRELHRFRQTRALGGAEPASGGITDQGGRVRFDRPEPPRAVHHPRDGDQFGGRIETQAGGGPVRPLLRSGGFRQ